MKTISKVSMTLSKASILFVLVFALHQTSVAQNLSAIEARGILQFDETVIDYGTIEKDADGHRTFSFTNVGEAPIVITEVKTSCGCTVASKPTGPVLPGERAEIGVKYKTSKVGAFTKTITVISNAAEGTKILKIKGTVVDAEQKLGQ
ncbi:MAG: DUF1573 domain-containing protein [Marinirhabdus sp.]|nr:DUF1573 domain-containing protein [Marinirhabdus sp.]